MACIWCLILPPELPLCQDDVIFDRADPIPFDFYAAAVACIKDKPCRTTVRIAVNPGFSNRRVEAQHGRFYGSWQQHFPFRRGINPTGDFWGLERSLSIE